MNKKASYWEISNSSDDNNNNRNEKQLVVCKLCPRECEIREGGHGVCFVRGVIGGELRSFAYGVSSGMCIDPIEKKPLYHFYPGSGVLSIGTIGCNLLCKFCQNWSISRSKDLSMMSAKATAADVVAVAENYGLKSIAYTYNEPTVFIEYAKDIAEVARASGIHSVAVTAGFINAKPREDFFKLMDAANVDLKGFNSDFYSKVIGAKLESVLDTLKYIREETNVWLEITNLLIPGVNDRESDIHAMCEWIVSNLGEHIPLHFSAFHPDWHMDDVPATPLKLLLRAKEIALLKGLRYVYLGNVRCKNNSTTICHQCSEVLIEREGYVVDKKFWKIKENVEGKSVCAKCGEVVAGFFDKLPADWGNKRIPIR
ncbi:MAG: AmmeMemoRadiSam system radical SAM enzyme [Oligoflexia bacterium]|nr:AmmeMemoRadiSam system radical SAM enzyme [Oligoflexia bacterium]